MLTIRISTTVTEWRKRPGYGTYLYRYAYVLGGSGMDIVGWSIS